MSHFDPESIDLARVARDLAEIFQGTTEGYVVGRTRLRDAVAELLECSVLQAEELIDSMIMRHLIEFLRSPAAAGHGAWQIRAQPPA